MKRKNPTLPLLLLLTVALLGLSQKASAFTVLIDIGSPGARMTTEHPQYWNNYTDITGATVLDLKDTSASDTGYTLSTANTYSHLGEYLAPPSDPYPNTATYDAFFAPSASTMTFAGLDASLTYNVTVYGYIRRKDSRLTNVTINGTTQSYEPSNMNNLANNGGSTTFSNLTPIFDSTKGQHVLDLNFTTTAGNYIIGVIELTAVPEPSRSLLLALGSSFLILRRRRH